MKRKLVIIVSIMFAAVGCSAVDSSNIPDAPLKAEDEANLLDEKTEPMRKEEKSDEEAEGEQLFDTLELEIEKGEMYIRTGDEFSFVGRDGSEREYEINGDTLYIKQREDRKSVLTLPEEAFSALYLDVNEGHVYTENSIELETLELIVRRGEVTLSEISVTDESKIEIGQGAAFVSGDLGSSVEASSKEGNLTMELTVSQSSYNYEISLTTGNIHLGREDYHGLRFTKSIDNGADNTMTLDCARGNLSVDFKK